MKNKKIEIDRKFKTIYYKNKPTRYKISNDGIVISTDYNNTGKTKELALIEDKNGYYKVGLRVMKNKQKNFRINRLVAIAFIPIPKKYTDLGLTYDDLEVNHKDGKKKNNHVDNLEWCTGKENVQHAEINGLRHHKQGAEHWNVKVSEKTIRKICKEASKNKLSILEISKKLNLDFHLVYRVVYGISWENISREYDLSNYNVKADRNINCPLRKNEKEIVIAICKDLQEGKLKMTEIAKKYNVKPRYVQSIKYRESWTNISMKYNFNKRKGKYHH